MPRDAGRLPGGEGERKLRAMALTRRWMKPAAPQRPAPRGKKVTHFEAGRYLGCMSCGRLLRIEWAVRSLVCSCGARIPVNPDEGKQS